MTGAVTVITKFLKNVFLKTITRQCQTYKLHFIGQLLKDFGKIGVCVGERALMTTLDAIKDTFDFELMKCKVEIEVS